MIVGHHSYVDFTGHSEAEARAANFNVKWINFEPGQTAVFNGQEEQLLILPSAPANISLPGQSEFAKARSVVVLPAEQVEVQMPDGGLAIHLSTSPSQTALNAGDYADRDLRIIPVGSASKRLPSVPGLNVIDVDAIVPHADKPRLKMIRSSVMSINWVEYEGPRDRSTLSPHAHSDFEQGTLAVTGDFVHHLRVPWSKNADNWRSDIHLNAGAGTLTIIPPGMVHTTEGIGGGKHLLIDIFAPARSDFIAKGWICNGGDYTENQ